MKHANMSLFLCLISHEKKSENEEMKAQGTLHNKVQHKAWKKDLFAVSEMSYLTKHYRSNLILNERFLYEVYNFGHIKLEQV